MGNIQVQSQILKIHPIPMDLDRPYIIAIMPRFNSISIPLRYRTDIEEIIDVVD